MKAKPRRKCADCPASTTKVYCRVCVRRHAKPAGSGAKVPVTLFSGSPESERRRRAVLDAIDLVPLIDREGWIPFLAWAERAGYEVTATTNRPRKFGRHVSGSRGAAERQWERLKARLREHGLEVEARAQDDYAAVQNQDRVAFSMTAMRFTVDGWDRLCALTKALDDWLCATRPDVEE